MKIRTLVTGIICVVSLGVAGVFGCAAYDSYNQIQLIDKSLIAVEQSLDLCKNSMPVQEDTPTYYDIYMEIANIAGVSISQVYVGSEENLITDASELNTLAQDTELHVCCVSMDQTSIIDIISLSYIESITQTDDGMEVVIKL